MKIRIFGAALLFCFGANAGQFKMTDGIIHSKSLYQNLNRIKVKGDKIDSIAGIEAAFHFEKNDKTGEIFIRPTEDNGYSPISLSLTTVSGKTQDLLLEVVDGEASTVELIAGTEGRDIPLSNLDEEISGNDYEENVCAVMKKFINLPKNCPEIEVRASDRNCAHLTASLEKAYMINGYLALKYRVTTSLQKASGLDERMFSRKGDICLSLSSLEIRPNTSVSLYVLRH